MTEEFNPDERKFSVTREIYDWLEAGMSAVIFVVVLFTFCGRLIGVDGESMMPTLESGDRLICSNLFYEPQNGDIVVITGHNDRHIPLVKRVIAVGGQTIYIDFDEGVVYVDGQALTENYINDKQTGTVTGQDFNYPLVVPEGHVFVMGDNRNNSWDSRYMGLGMVDQRYLLGKVVYRLTPYEHMGVPK